MEETLLKICGVAILCAFGGAALGKLSGGIGSALRIGGLALVLGGGLALMEALSEDIQTFGSAAEAAGYTALMLKALGISVLCRICSDVCRDCGEQSLGGAVETVGKLTLVGLAMPTVIELIAYAKDILDRI